MKKKEALAVNDLTTNSKKCIRIYLLNDMKQINVFYHSDFSMAGLSCPIGSIFNPESLRVYTSLVSLGPGRHLYLTTRLKIMKKAAQQIAAITPRAALV